MGSALRGAVSLLRARLALLERRRLSPVAATGATALCSLPRCCRHRRLRLLLGTCWVLKSHPKEQSPGDKAMTTPLPPLGERGGRRRGRRGSSSGRRRLLCNAKRRAPCWLPSPEQWCRIRIAQPLAGPPTHPSGECRALHVHSPDSLRPDRRPSVKGNWRAQPVCGGSIWSDTRSRS